MSNIDRIHFEYTKVFFESTRNFLAQILFCSSCSRYRQIEYELLKKFPENVNQLVLCNF